MRWSGDTACVRSLVQRSTWKYSLLPHWTGKLIYMRGEACCGRCVVQGQGRAENTFHELLKESTWKGKNAAWPLFGKLYLQVGKHLVLQPGIGKLFFYFDPHQKHSIQFALLLCMNVKEKPAAKMFFIIGVLTSPPGIKVFSCRNTHIVLSL